MKVSTLLGSSITALLISTSGLATAADKAVLVLDGSGSMWGQVGDTAKIEIARDVIGDLMLDWSSKVELGLSAYGHREKGNCADIETLKPIGPVDPKEVAQLVDAISPKGKTPLTDAVRRAADELRYEEDRATVILVSDGEETCGGDPCAVARELEAAGVDFTIHVVGFNLTDNEAANLQCIADNTGGSFLQAANAEELHQAMAVVKEVVTEQAEAAPLNQWAASVVETRQARRNNGSSVNPERAMPETMLGRAQTKGRRIDNVKANKNAFSLGFGGSVTLFFEDAILNGPGMDGLFYEVTSAPYPDEKIRIEASRNGNQWTLVHREGVYDTEFDLGELECASFIRITDVSNRNEHDANSDAFDLDAAQVCQCSTWTM